MKTPFTEPTQSQSRFFHRAVQSLLETRKAVGHRYERRQSRKQLGHPETFAEFVTSTMKHSSLCTLTLLVTGLLLVTAHSAQAFNYSDTDVLLIFRADGYDDVEFDLGNIEQFLDKTNGYQVTVGNWSQHIVYNNFALTNGLAQFFVLAVTSDQDPSPRAWVTDSQPQVGATNVSGSQWELGLYGTISGTGQAAQADPNAPVGTNYDVVAPINRYAFDFITSNGGQTPSLIPYLGGGSGLKFRSATLIPGTALFYEVSPSSTLPRTAAKLVGSFTLDGNGVLTFHAGASLDAAQITSAALGAGAASVTFNTKAGVNYRLRYSSQVSAPPSSWTILSGSIVGDGNPHTLQDTSPRTSTRFYRVESFP